MTEKTKCLLIVSWDFRCEITDEEFDEWYYTSVCQAVEAVRVEELADSDG